MEELCEVKPDIRLRVSIVKICNVILRNGKMRRSKYFAVIACVRLHNTLSRNYKLSNAKQIFLLFFERLSYIDKRNKN